MKFRNQQGYVYTYRKVRRKGRMDGRGFRWRPWPFKEAYEPRPTLDQAEHAQFEHDLLKAGEQEINRLSEGWEQKDRTLKMNYCLAKSNLHKAQLAYNKEGEEARTASQSFDAISEEYHNLGVPALSSGWMIFWLIIFGIVEIPLNYIVFQTLAENYILTLILAAGLCAAVPYAAHHFGRAIKQHEKTYTDKILIIILPLLIVAMLSGVALIRTAYFEAVQENMRIMHINISPGALNILFILINLTIFFVAILVSYQGHHENHKQYKNLRKRYRNAKKILIKESGEEKAAAEQLSRLNDDYNRSKVEREAYHKQYCERARYIISLMHGYMEIYRTFNIEARKSAAKPNCFKLVLLTLRIPENLLSGSLSWECPDDPKKNETGNNNLIYKN